MENKFFNWIYKNTWPAALFLNIILIVILNTFCTPLLNSGDDALIMYPLSGEYGNPPTYLLHYKHGWHPWLGSFISKLFNNWPGINWYTIILLLFHLLGLSAILYVFIKKLKPALAFFIFSILFFFIESRQLLSLTFTGAAFVCGAGVFFLLLHDLAGNKWKSKNIFFAIFLLLLAGLLRLHIVWLVIFLFSITAFVVLTRIQLVRWGIISAFILIFLFIANQIHVAHYKSQIPKWEEREAIRQTLINVFNKPISKDIPWQDVFKDSIERDSYSAGLYYDSSLFTTQRLEEIGNKLIRQRWLNKDEDKTSLYWFFIGIRIYLLLFLVLLAMMWMYMGKARAFKWIAMTLPSFGALGFLFVYMKITLPVLLGLFMVMLIQPVLLVDQKSEFKKTIKVKVLGAALLFFFLFIWMGVRLDKENETNKNSYSKFLCYAEDLKRNPDKLFLCADDDFPVSYFYIWDNPKNYPLNNFLYKGWWLSNGYPQIMKRFGIDSAGPGFFKNPQVYLMGKQVKAMEKYFEGGTLSEKIPGFNCLEIRKIVYPVQ